MIARIWYGATRAADAESYLEYVRSTGVAKQRATPGNRGSVVLRRIQGDRAEVIVLSLWESMEAIEAFAGPSSETAVYYPEDRRYLLEMSPGVDHYEVAAGGFAPDGGVAG